MEPWMLITLGAAFAQTLRFMAQKQLKTVGLSTGGATFARFVYSAPLVAALILSYSAVSGQALPGTNGRFWAFAMVGGGAQILATMCVVAIFSHRNFAVGITFKKTEVVQTAIVSAVVLGERVSAIGAIAIGIGFCGVLLLSDPPGGHGAWRKRVFNRAAGLGLLSGVFFAFSAVGYRGASLALDSGDVILRAGYTLAIVTAVQTAVMTAWLGAREPGQIGAVFGAWRIAGLVGLTSMIGSFCWFTAFTLQNAAYVNALGQVELLFSVAASVLVFREKVSLREAGGMALLTCSILVLILAL
ncbi:DMT family transporter [Oceaniglobus ichthyenteri]|uniref:DMT family transporter n=1 Tax=Oceaniglobus ichthyenteri TaxID=2136177 RepID=UPI000D3BFC6B|nr:DMT family transporter [Oceaniglobus ichthyenteri]